MLQEFHKLIRYKELKLEATFIEKSAKIIVTIKPTLETAHLKLLQNKFQFNKGKSTLKI